VRLIRGRYLWIGTLRQRGDDYEAEGLPEVALNGGRADVVRFREESGKLMEKCRRGDGWITKLEQEIRKVCRAHQEVVGPLTCPIYSSDGETVETNGGTTDNKVRTIFTRYTLLSTVDRLSEVGVLGIVRDCTRT